MDKSSLSARLSNHFVLIDRLHGRASKKLCPDDLHQLRYLCSKVLHTLDSNDSMNREVVLKNGAHLTLLMTLIEFYNDPPISVTVVQILLELVGKSQSGKRLSRLISHNATNILFQLLAREWKETTPNEDLILYCHQLLAKLGTKERKFGLKARLNQGLTVTMGMLKNNCSNFRVLNCIIPVLKLYSLNGVNSSYLGKQNVIPYLFKVATSCGKKHTNVLKHALNTLVNLTKSKSNSARTIGQDGVRSLLSWHVDWHHFDSKNRHIPLRKAILSILKNVTNLKSGRKAFVEGDGVSILYNSCLEMEDCREMESVILAASLILRKCCPKNKLPLLSINSPVSFTLPASEYYNLYTCPSPVNYNITWDKKRQDSDTDTGSGKLSGEASQTSAEAVDSDHSSLDDDDDFDSDDDRSKQEKTEVEEEVDDTDSEPLYRRSPDELQSYHVFFPELMDFQVLDESSSTPECAIVIPTAATDSFNPEVSPSGQTSFSNKHINSQPDLDNGSCSPLSGQQVAWTDSQMLPSSTTAINLKTGTTVIHLDWSTAKKLQSTPAVSKSFNKSLGKSPKKSGASKEKKSKKSASEGNWLQCPDFLEALSITQLPGPHFITPEPVANEKCRGSDEMPINAHDPDVYSLISDETNSVLPFTKLAYPDLHGSIPVPSKEPLYHRKFGVQRKKIFEDIDRMIHPDLVIDKVVYDLDDLITSLPFPPQPSRLTNDDEIRVNQPSASSNTLVFNSRFECGNLRKAVQVREFEYDLILNPDVNTNHHHQWFYFEVSNTVAGQSYRFNIINCEKLNSQFNFGMRPVLYSVKEALAGRPYWMRKGSEICYYRNHFIRSSAATGGLKGKSYYTTTFTITFQHDQDVCYLAYHFPYTYTSLKTHIARWESAYDKNQIYYHRETLCETISGNAVPLLTLTSMPHSWDRDGIEEFRQRPFIFLSARVHPGESNSSWVMKGTLEYLFSDKPQAKALRDMFIFKIVPMLNPDGVINGVHRCSLTAEDLNRRWQYPCPKLHPTIYHTKGLLLYMAMINRAPLVFCDYHGHSRRKNVFLYGCSPYESWISEDQNNPAVTSSLKSDLTAFKSLPRILHSLAPAFSLSNCSYIVEKTKESTARVVVWRQVGVLRSYTMESSYCGCDQGIYKDQHIGTNILEEMGRKFCDGLLRVGRSRPVVESTPTDTPSSSQSEFNNPPTYEEPADEAGVPDGAEALSDSLADSDDDDSDDDDDDRDDDNSPDETEDDNLFL